MGNCIESLFGKKDHERNQSLITKIQMTVLHQTTNNKHFSIYQGVPRIQSFLEEVNLRKKDPPDHLPFINQEIDNLDKYLANYDNVVEMFKSNSNKIRKQNLLKSNIGKELSMIKLQLQSMIVGEKISGLLISTENRKINCHLQPVEDKDKSKDIINYGIYQVYELYVDKKSSILFDAGGKGKATIVVEDLMRQLIVGDIISLRNSQNIFGYITIRAQTFEKEYKLKLELIKKVHEQLKKQLMFCLEGESGWQKLSSFRNESQERSSYISHEDFSYKI